MNSDLDLVIISFSEIMLFFQLFFFYKFISYEQWLVFLFNFIKLN